MRKYFENNINGPCLLIIYTGPAKLLRRADVKRYRKITSVKAVAVLIAQFLCGQTRILCIFCIFFVWAIMDTLHIYLFLGGQ